MRYALTTALIAAVAACAGVGGCSPRDGSPDAVTLLGQDATDATEVEAQASSLTAELTLPATGANVATPGPRDLFENADKIGAFFTNPSCVAVVKAADGQNVTYTFTQCTGVWGLSLLDGSITVTFASAQLPDGSSVASMTVNGTVDLRRGQVTFHDAVATLTTTGLQRTMTWDGKVTGKTARGRVFSRTVHWTLGWTVGVSQCVALSGNASGGVGLRQIDTVVTGYQRCRGECPQAGKINVTEKPSGTTFEIDFNGTSVAQYLVNSTEHDVELACGI